MRWSGWSSARRTTILVPGVSSWSIPVCLGVDVVMVVLIVQTTKGSWRKLIIASVYLLFLPLVLFKGIKNQSTDYNDFYKYRI